MLVVFPWTSKLTILFLIDLFQVEGEYSWVDGWPVWFTNWGTSEPSKDAGEGCVAVEFDGSWDDTDCNRKLMPLCKYSLGMYHANENPLIECKHNVMQIKV